MKKILLNVLLFSLLYAEEATVIAIERMHWSVSCSNDIDYMSIVQFKDKTVKTFQCTHLGKVGLVVNIKR